MANALRDAGYPNPAVFYSQVILNVKDDPAFQVQVKGQLRLWQLNPSQDPIMLVLDLEQKTIAISCPGVYTFIKM